MNGSGERPDAPRVVRVAVVGRPNVGKSTLVNRLAGRNQAIAHESAGVTRDRLEVPARWGARSLLLVDTGGYLPRARGIDVSIVRQATRAMDSAALTLLVVDVSSGISEEDVSLARALQRASRPVLVVANKVDSQAQEPLAAEFHALGLGEPVMVSALHGRGAGDLLDRVLDLVPEGADPQDEDEIRFCLVGRPNVGKSSLFNRILKEERAVVHEEPGTTRDAVDSLVEIDGRRIRFVDTAGFRRPLRTTGVEYYGLVRSMRAIEGSHVAALIIDAFEGLTGEDKRVAARVAESGRGLAAVLNKWDLLPSGGRADRFIDLRRQLELFPGTPVIRVSALTGGGVGRLVPAMMGVHQAWMRRVPTAEVNRVLASATAASPPPRSAGPLRYATQVSAGPPTFVLFGSREPPPAYRRYLENSLRRAFGFDGVPVRLSFRVREPRYGGGRPVKPRRASSGSGERAGRGRPTRSGR